MPYQQYSLYGSTCCVASVCVRLLHHRTGPDSLQYPSHRWLSLLGRRMVGLNVGSHAQAQLMNPLQVPSDVLSGSRPSSRRVTVRLIRFTLGRCWPRTIPWKASWRTRRHWYIGQKQANSTCSVTSDGTTGNSMLSRVRRTHPPSRWGSVVGADLTGVPHPLGRGHLFTGKTMPPLPAAEAKPPTAHPQLPLLRLGKRKGPPPPRSARISR